VIHFRASLFQLREPFADTTRAWAIEGRDGRTDTSLWGTFVVRFLLSSVLSTPAATAHVVGFSMGAFVAGEQASVLPGLSLTLPAPALTNIERGNSPRGPGSPQA
jgi:hypothetical protein